MARDLAIVCLVGALVFFMFGVAIGTSQYLGMLIAWILAIALLLAALFAGARAVLLDAFPPKR